MGISDNLAGPQGDPHGRCHADGRSTTHHHPLDCLGHGVEISIALIDLFHR